MSVFDYQLCDYQLVKANLKIDSDWMARADDADEYAAAGAFKPRDHQIVKANLKIDSDGMARAGNADEYAAAGAFDHWDGVGAYAGAGLGHVELDGGDVQANGPNVGAGVQLSLTEGARAVVKAELVSVSASAGPTKVTLGVSAETGGTIGLTQVEAKVLGTGFSFGRKMGISFLGSEFEFKLW